MLSVIMLVRNSTQACEDVIQALRKHFTQIETTMRPHFICMCNAVNEVELIKLESMNFDTLISSRERLTYGVAMNCLISDVRTQYALILSDGWMFTNFDKVPFVANAIRIFVTDNNISQVKLGKRQRLDCEESPSLEDGTFLSPDRTFGFCARNSSAEDDEFNFVPSIIRMSALYELGPISEDIAHQREFEKEISARSKGKFVSATNPRLSCLFAEQSEVKAPRGATRPHILGDDARSARSQSNLTPGNGKVACLVTAYRRPNNLARQLRAVEQQTVRPSEIAIWRNFHLDHDFDQDTLNRFPNIVSSNHNWGVWPRFLFCNEF